jgi:hypothetical protein
MEKLAKSSKTHLIYMMELAHLLFFQSSHFCKGARFLLRLCTKTAAEAAATK